MTLSQKYFMSVANRHFAWTFTAFTHFSKSRHKTSDYSFSSSVTGFKKSNSGFFHSDHYSDLSRCVLWASANVFNGRWGHLMVAV